MLKCQEASPEDSHLKRGLEARRLVKNHQDAPARTAPEAVS